MRYTTINLDDYLLEKVGLRLQAFGVLFPHFLRVLGREPPRRTHLKEQLILIFDLAMFGGQKTQ